MQLLIRCYMMVVASIFDRVSMESTILEHVECAFDILLNSFDKHRWEVGASVAVHSNMDSMVPDIASSDMTVCRRWHPVSFYMPPSEAGTPETVNQYSSGATLARYAWLPSPSSSTSQYYTVGHQASIIPTMWGVFSLRGIILYQLIKYQTNSTIFHRVNSDRRFYFMDVTSMLSNKYTEIFRTLYKYTYVIYILVRDNF